MFNHASRGRVAAAVLGLALVVAFILGRSSSSSAPSVGRVLDGGRRFIMASDARGSSCAIQLVGHDAVAYFSSASLNVEPACQAAEQLQASQGNLWASAPGDVTSSAQTGSPAPVIAGDALICHLAASGAQVSLWVFDSGEAIYGGQLCDGYVSAGWIER